MGQGNLGVGKLGPHPIPQRDAVQTKRDGKLSKKFHYCVQAGSAKLEYFCNFSTEGSNTSQDKTPPRKKRVTTRPKYLQDFVD